jgi:two-component system sensor histidine kinase/response regulator
MVQAPERTNGAAGAVIDEAIGLRYAGNKPDLYLRLLRRFQETQQDLPARIEAAREAADHTEAYRLAHTLKSAAATIGAVQLSALAQLLEARCHELQAVPPGDEFAALCQALTEVMAGIEARLAT